MSERMTDDRFSLLTDPEGGAWTDDDANEVAREAARARHSEAALADVGAEILGALELLGRGDGRAPAAIAQSAGRICAALRLAGRLL